MVPPHGCRQKGTRFGPDSPLPEHTGAVGLHDVLSLTSSHSLGRCRKRINA